MSAALPAITRDSHVAAGHGLGIGQYIEEMVAQGFSDRKIEKALKQSGLTVARQSKREPSCIQIEEALERLDYYGALSALRDFRQFITDRDARRDQLSCLMMRLEYRFGETSDICQLWLKVLRT